MGAVVGILFGPLIWVAHFAILYGSHASVCAASGRAGQLPGSLVPALALATALALVLVAIPLGFPRRFAAIFLAGKPQGETRFMLSLTRWLAGLSVVAVLANGLALVVVAPC